MRPMLLLAACVAVLPAACTFVHMAPSAKQVRDELETLARNEAPGVGADSISPLTPPRDGEQRWAMWRCG